MKKLSMLLVVTIIVSMLTTFAVMPASAEQTVYCNYDMSGYTGKNPTIFSQAFPGWNEASYWNGSAYNDAEYGNGLQMGKAAVVEHTLTTPITSGKILLRVNAKVLDTSSYAGVGFLGMLMNDSELTGSTSPEISSGDRNNKPQAFKIRVAKNSVTVSTSATGGYANIYKKDEVDQTVAVTEGEWHQYDTLVDFTAGKKYIYVDGKLLTDCTLDSAIQTSGIKSVLISANNLLSANDNKGVVVDNFKICTLNDSFAVSSASVDTATKKITVEFNEVLDGDFAPTTAVITAEDNSDTKGAASITKKGFNSLEIAYEGILSKNKKYKVTFGADVVKDEFGNTLTGDISFTTPAGYQEYYSNDMSSYNGGKVEMTGLTAFPNYYNDGAKSYWNGSAYDDAEYGNGLQMGTAAVVEHTLTTPITSGKVLLRVNAKVLDTSSYTGAGFLGMLMNDSEITMSTSPNLSQSTRNDKPQAFKIRVAKNSVTVSTSATGGYANIYNDKSVAVTEGEWHQYDTLVDFTAGKKYIYVDGKLLTDCTLDSAIQTSGIKSVLISANSLLSANDNKGVVVDNFKICTMQESFEAEKVEVDTATKKITVKFNEVLDGDLAATTAVINDASGTPYTSVNVAKTGFDTLTFTYSDDELPVGKGYTMGFTEGSEIKDEFGNTLSKNITFDVKGTGMTLDEVKLTTTEGAAITDLTAFNNAAADVSAKVSGSITNWDGKDDSAVLLVAAYDSTGMKLTYVGTKSLTVTGYEYTVNEEITIPKNTEVGKIKLFVWSGLSTPAPLGGTTVIPAE